MDNKGGVDIFNNWSIAGNTRAVSIRFAYIRELKEAGILQIKWIKGEENGADLFTKNLDGNAFHKHAAVFNGSTKAKIDRSEEEECWNGDAMGTIDSQDQSRPFSDKTESYGGKTEYRSPDKKSLNGGALGESPYKLVGSSMSTGPPENKESNKCRVK